MVYHYKYAIRELVRRKGRTFVLVAGYGLVVAVTVILISFMYVGEKAADKVLTHTGTHFIVFVPAKNNEGKEKIIGGKVPRLTHQNVEILLFQNQM